MHMHMLMQMHMHMHMHMHMNMHMHMCMHTFACLNAPNYPCTVTSITIYSPTLADRGKQLNTRSYTVTRFALAERVRPELTLLAIPHGRLRRRACHESRAS